MGRKIPAAGLPIRGRSGSILAATGPSQRDSKFPADLLIMERSIRRGIGRRWNDQRDLAEGSCGRSPRGAAPAGAGSAPVRPLCGFNSPNPPVRAANTVRLPTHPTRMRIRCPVSLESCLALRGCRSHRPSPATLPRLYRDDEVSLWRLSLRPAHWNRPLKITAGGNSAGGIRTQMRTGCGIGRCL